MSRSGIQPSVPAAGAGPIDWAHLARATFGDQSLAREVLTLFDAQAQALAAALRDLPPDAAALAHKLKGSAQGIGAVGVARAVQAFEAALAARGDPAPALTTLVRELAAARVEIAERRERLIPSPGNAGAAQTEPV